MRSVADEFRVRRRDEVRRMSVGERVLLALQLVVAVDRSLGELPERCAELWRTLLESRRGASV